MKLSEPCAFCFGGLLIIDVTYIIDIGLFRLSPCVFGLTNCVFQEIGPFHLGYHICEYRVVCSILILSIMSMGAVVMFPLSFLIFII